MADDEQRYAALLLEWNRRMNLTGAKDAGELAVHLRQARKLLELPWEGIRTVIDIGSGGGLPAIPLAIALPDVAFTLLDASVKKTAFLQHAAGSLRLANVVVEAGRAEELGHRPGLRERFDRALSRAAARPAVLLELALPFVRVGGDLLAPIGKEDLGSLAAVAERLGGSAPHAQPLGPGELALVVTKVAPTPADYPRRAGLPQRRPLR